MNRYKMIVKTDENVMGTVARVTIDAEEDKDGPWVSWFAVQGLESQLLDLVLRQSGLVRERDALATMRRLEEAGLSKRIAELEALLAPDAVSAVEENKRLKAQIAELGLDKQELWRRESDMIALLREHGWAGSESFEAREWLRLKLVELKSMQREFISIRDILEELHGSVERHGLRRLSGSLSEWIDGYLAELKDARERLRLGHEALYGSKEGK